MKAKERKEKKEEERRREETRKGAARVKSTQEVRPRRVTFDRSPSLLQTRFASSRWAENVGRKRSNENNLTIQGAQESGTFDNDPNHRDRNFNLGGRQHE